jgi:hypothetical protein
LQRHDDLQARYVMVMLMRRDVEAAETISPCGVAVWASASTGCAKVLVC